MNDIVSYLGTHHEIRELVLVMGVRSSESLVYDVCSMAKLNKLVLVVPTAELKKEVRNMLSGLRFEERCHMPDSIEWISRDKIHSYCAETENMAMMFDALNSTEEILDLADLKPGYLIGIGDRKKINAFGIWEIYRKISHHIYLLTWEENCSDEALNWSKNPNSDIELSVIFPVYGVAAYLEKCIRSVTAWKADYVEYLFVDDGSPDNSAEIIREYAKGDSRIKLFRKENGGCASARQYGLERANGRYVGFVDPDDYVDETMFRKLFARALCGSYEISYCGYKELYEDTQTTKEVPDSLDLPYRDGTCDRYKIDELIAYERVAIWRGIYSKDMIVRNKIHFYTDIRRFDDLPFKVETLSVARSVVAIPEYLYYYRMSRPGQDISADDERLYVHFPIFAYLDKFFATAKEKVQLDYLQVVKVHTHRYALQKLRPEFIDEYCRQAGVDLLSNFTYAEGKYILRNFASRKDRLYFMALCKKKIWLVRLLTGYKGSNKGYKRKQRQLMKFEELNNKYGKNS